MAVPPLHNLTIRKFHDGLLDKAYTALEVAEAYFAHIRATDKALGAYLSVSEERALRDAEQTDLALARGEEIPLLAGVPLAVKDAILIEGEPCTAASKMLERYVASYDATVIKKLKAARAVFLGKTNLDEFAMGSSNENSAFHPTKNPHDHARVPGGSSGGSAAAVAGHLALASLGSDTGGSIRQPANFCGVVGLKPTYGAVSRSGLIAMTSSLDQIGPIAKTVEDAAILFDAIRGRDSLDATSSDADYGPELLAPDFKKIKNLRIGLPKEYFVEGIAPEVRSAVERAIGAFKSLGLSFKEISLPHTKYALSAYYLIVPAEVSANLARFDGVRYARRESVARSARALGDIYLDQRGGGFGPEVKRRVILGTFVLSSGYYDAYYEKAQRVRTLIRQDFAGAFREVDVVLTPVAPTTAFKLGEKTNDPLSMYLEDIFTLPVNLAGLPALAVPAESARVPAPRRTLPVGFQLIGKPFREADIVGLGRFYEELGSGR